MGPLLSLESASWHTEMTNRVAVRVVIFSATFHREAGTVPKRHFFQKTIVKTEHEFYSVIHQSLTAQFDQLHAAAIGLYLSICNQGLLPNDDSPTDQPRLALPRFPRDDRLAPFCRSLHHSVDRWPEERNSSKVTTTRAASSPWGEELRLNLNGACTFNWIHLRAFRKPEGTNTGCPDSRWFFLVARAYDLHQDHSYALNRPYDIKSL